MVLRGLLVGTGIGAGAMYWLDPKRGRRRRALARDRVRHWRRVGNGAIGATATDVATRTRGLLAEGAALLRSQDAPDEVLAERVRAVLGFYATHPRAIAVRAERGVVTLDGPVLAAEVRPLVARVRRMRGVRRVESRLDVHESPEAVPAFQGGGEGHPGATSFLRQRWSPATRLVVGALGLGCVAYGMRRGGPVGVALGVLGVGLVARSETNRPLGWAEAGR
jgi:hypothetical protein